MSVHLLRNPETKRRFNSLVHASGLAEQLVLLPPPKPASATELTRVHTAAHVERIATLSANKVAIVHNLGDAVSMSYGGYEIAALAAGGGLALVDAVMSGRIDNGYALLRYEICARSIMQLHQCCCWWGHWVVAHLPALPPPQHSTPTNTRTTQAAWTSRLP
jgi:hypothetical protein